MNGEVLVLNSDFEPLNVCNLRRAIILVYLGKAEVLHATAHPVPTFHGDVHSPSVVKLHHHVKRPLPQLRLSRRGIFARDDYTCQYCHRTQADLRHRECLTRDHLVPMSRGGGNEWTNVVTACSSCNTKKGNHLPEECGMHPAVPPMEPHFVHLAWAVRRLTAIQAKYIRLFYGEEALRAIGG